MGIPKWLKPISFAKEEGLEAVEISKAIPFPQ